MVFKFGKEIGNLSADEAMVKAGLNFNVALGKAFVSYTEEDRERLQQKGKELYENKITYRTDTGLPLGIVKNRYEIVQNREIFSFLDEIVKGEKLEYCTAGVIDGGKTAFASVKLPNYMNLGFDDIVNNYLAFITSHDGSGALKIIYTPVRIFCSNTLRAAVRDADAKVSLKHTRNIKYMLDRVKQNIIHVNELSTFAEHSYKGMIKTRFGNREFLDLVSEIILTPDENESYKRNNHSFLGVDEISTRKKNIIAGIVDYREIGVGQDSETTKGTLFGAYNAITGYYNNVKEYNSEATRFNTLVVGGSNDILQQAFVKSLNLIN